MIRRQTGSRKHRVLITRLSMPGLCLSLVKFRIATSSKCWLRHGLPNLTSGRLILSSSATLGYCYHLLVISSFAREFSCSSAGRVKDNYIVECWRFESRTPN
ncbi:hypothetical protein BDV96DRAFT_587708 [Lophiotrema nucula]|uniref:Uncharacterized protein n=1 Tax=Lophiotrema nucula TaxID=690887 RepID=A0A6A5YQI5_9PLEO|nr:hypothetical protein BDV96DRAFT_587708 [Lophiotrema nucula]